MQTKKPLIRNWILKCLVRSAEGGLPGVTRNQEAAGGASPFSTGLATGISRPPPPPSKSPSMHDAHLRSIQPTQSYLLFALNKRPAQILPNTQAITPNIVITDKTANTGPTDPFE